MRALTRFRTEAEGVSAIEFALLAPAVLLLFMGAIELPRAYDVSQAVEQSTRTMADLVSRGMTDLSEVYAAGRAVADPHNIESARIVLTAFGVYSQDNVLRAKVCSSVAQNAAARTVGEPLRQPPAEYVDGDRYVTAEVELLYVPIFSVFPVLNNASFRKAVTWPVRNGTAVNGKPEVILPGGQACPSRP